MPEVVIPDKYADSVPRFVLPKELTNPPPDASPEVKEVKPTTPVIPAEPPQEAKPATEAVAIPPVETPDTEAEKDPEKASQRRFERRIDRAHRARAEALARAEAAERRLQEFESKQAPVPSSKPKMEDFTDIAEFEKAVDKFAREEAVKDYENKQRDGQTQAATLRLTQAWDAKVTKGASQYDDFDEVVGDLKPTTAWASALMEAENGEEIAYFLGKHPKEAQRIIALSPLSQVREIGKLEVKLSLKAEAPKTPSKAPPPITPISGAAAVSPDEIKTNQPFEEYQKIGNKMFRGR